jgi:hypothetical protein
MEQNQLNATAMSADVRSNVAMFLESVADALDVENGEQTVSAEVVSTYLREQADKLRDMNVVAGATSFSEYGTESEEGLTLRTTNEQPC